MKPGDLIRVINKDCAHYTEIGQIVELYPHDRGIVAFDYDSYRNMFRMSDVELFKSFNESKPKFKVGDIVKMKSDDGFLNDECFEVTGLTPNIIGCDESEFKKTLYVFNIKGIEFVADEDYLELVSEPEITIKVSPRELKVIRYMIDNIDVLSRIKVTIDERK